MAREPARDRPAAVDERVERVAEAPPLALGHLNNLLGYHIAQAAVSTVELYERHVGQPFGLRKAEYSMLMLILANGPLAPKHLAAALSLSAPNMSMLLDRMQARGLLRRERSQVDRRSQNVVLTAEGERIAQASGLAAEPMAQALFDRLSPAEHAMLIELLRKVALR